MTATANGEPRHGLLSRRWPRFRTEVDEELAPPVLRLPRAKRIAKKIELVVGVIPSPIFILTIDNLRLLRMKLQSTLLQPLPYSTPNLLSLTLRPAMHDGIIGIPLERQMRILPRIHTSNA